MKIRFGAGLALGLMLAACQQGETTNGTVADATSAERSNRTIGESLGGAAGHSSFMAAIDAAGMAEVLRGAGPYTVFAPTNAAFDAVPEETRQALMAEEQRAALTGLLSYHIVPGVMMAADIGAAIDRAGGRAEIASVAGANLSASRDGDAILITDGAGGTARVVEADMVQSNGVVHGIDALLMPAD